MEHPLPILQVSLKAKLAWILAPYDPLIPDRSVWEMMAIIIGRILACINMTADADILLPTDQIVAIIDAEADRDLLPHVAGMASVKITTHTEMKDVTTGLTRRVTMDKAEITRPKAAVEGRQAAIVEALGALEALAAVIDRLDAEVEKSRKPSRLKVDS